MIRWIRAISNLAPLGSRWRALLEDCEGSVFQSPEWLLAWWNAFGGGGQLLVGVIERDGALEALAPFYVRQEAHGPDALLFLGTGNSDRLDVLSRTPADGRALTRAAMDQAGAHRWPCYFGRIPAGSAVLHVDAGRRSVVTTDIPCPVMALPRTAAALDDALDGHFRRNLRTRARKAQRLGPVRFEVARGGAVPGALDQLFALHTERWSAKGARGVLADPVVRAFHRAAADRLDAVGMLRLLRMWIGTELAAVYYGFQTRVRASFYIGGFNMRLATVSPAAQLMREALRMAIEDGAGTFDFLSGREPYKYEWGAVDTPYFARTVEAS